MLNKVLLTIIACVLAPGLVAGQPINGSVRVLVGGSAGGPSDMTIRMLVPRLSAGLGQSIFVDNRPGTLQQAAVDQLKSAPPDGRTLMLGNSGTHTIFPSLYRNVQYDPISDFAPISLVNSTGLVLVAHPSVPSRSIAEFVALAKKFPGRLNIGVAGPTGEVALEAMTMQLKMQVGNIRYKGSAPAEVAAISGEVELALLTPVATINHVRAGKLRALGVTTAERLQLMPAVPTIAEAGVKGYSFEFWNGLFARADTPPKIVSYLHKELIQAMDHPDIKERFVALGFNFVGSSPQELAALIKGELSRFRKLAAETGIGNRS